MYLIQLLLPLYTNQGKYFDKNLYATIKEELTQSFGGVTMFTRAPAVGIWKENDKNVLDEIIIFEVMVEEIKYPYWNVYKIQLQEIFEQDTIIIRTSKIEVL